MVVRGLAPDMRALGVASLSRFGIIKGVLLELFSQVVDTPASLPLGVAACRIPEIR